MASDSSEGRPVSVTLPPSLDEWLSDRAEATGVERERLLVDLLTAYRGATEAEAGGDVLDAVVTDRVDERIGRVRSEFGDQLDDVRARVIQVKRAADSKADAEQVEQLASAVERLDGAVSGLSEDLSTVEAELERFDETLAGLEGDVSGLREDIRTRAETDVALDDRLDDIESKLTRVARVVVTLREAHERQDDGAVDPTGRTPDDDEGTADGAAEEPTADREPVPRFAGGGPDEALVGIKRTAAREGVRSASCGACGDAVDLALLPEAACPHCGTAFGGLEGETGVFRSPTLVGPGATGEGGENSEDADD